MTPSNAPLTITRIGAVANRKGDAAAGVTFTDADPQGTLSQYSGTIDWGDGSPPGTASFVRLRAGLFGAGGVHSYASPGPYTIVITINDSGGASSNKTTTVTVPSR